MSTPRPQGKPGRTALESRRWLTLLLALGAAVLIVGAFALYVGWRSLSEEEVVRRFALLRSARHPEAAELLIPFTMPKRTVSQEEAERLDAECLLHQPFRVLEVRPLRGSAGRAGTKQWVLVIQGRFSTEPLQVEGFEQPQQRFLINPDLIVEVHNGKVHGVRAQLHED